MCRAMKPKQHALQGMLSCGGVQTQAPVLQPGVTDFCTESHLLVQHILSGSLSKPVQEQRDISIGISQITTDPGGEGCSIAERRFHPFLNVVLFLSEPLFLVPRPIQFFFFSLNWS